MRNTIEKVLICLLFPTEHLDSTGIPTYIKMYQVLVRVQKLNREVRTSSVWVQV